MGAHRRPADQRVKHCGTKGLTDGQIRAPERGNSLKQPVFVTRDVRPREPPPPPRHRFAPPPAVREVPRTCQEIPGSRPRRHLERANAWTFPTTQPGPAQQAASQPPLITGPGRVTYGRGRSGSVGLLLRHGLAPLLVLVLVRLPDPLGLDLESLRTMDHPVLAEVVADLRGRVEQPRERCSGDSTTPSEAGSPVGGRSGAAPGLRRPRHHRPGRTGPRRTARGPFGPGGRFRAPSRQTYSTGVPQWPEGRRRGARTGRRVRVRLRSPRCLSGSSS
ncbi:hypothetical protein EES39_39575 [Streptomyces sp. ADI92-24]|nr:hypothetical protein EES39_39575 [Streptomyces sp. ADI92-24]